MSEIYTARNIPRRYPCRMFKINPIQISPQRHPFWLAKISTSDIENMSLPGSFRGSIRNGLPNYIYIQITPRKYPQRVSKIYPVADLPRRHPHRMSEIYTARNNPRRSPCRMFKINPIRIKPDHQTGPSVPVGQSFRFGHGKYITSRMLPQNHP